MNQTAATGNGTATRRRTILLRREQSSQEVEAQAGMTATFFQSSAKQRPPSKVCLFVGND
jgi:hypothetical protein